MLRYFYIILILILFNILYSSNLFEYSHGYNNLYGNVDNFSNFFNTEFYDWEFSDELFIKYSTSDTPLYNTYKNNYVRNHLRISRSGKNHFFSAWISGEIYSKDNYSTDFIGLAGDYRLKQGVSTGMDIIWKSSSFKTAISGKYLGRNYKFEGVNENEFDGNMISFGEVSLIDSKKWQPFISFFHFNDLNENNYLGYSKFSAGIKYKNKFKREYVLKQQISAGYTDLYQNIPYFIQSDTRLSAKFGQKWMGFGKIYFQLFADEKIQELYSGNSFTELMIQRNFSIDKDNYFARMRAGIVINPVDHSLIIKSSFVYPYKRFEFSGEYKFYPGDENAFSKEHSINTGWNYYLRNKTIQVGYNLGYLTYKGNYSNLLGQDSEMSHKIIFDLNL